ncbi:MAG TPA: dimethylargininase [Blastocatellia bacterium]|nr:dimethylargininase [Blastocatellia bacterium]
MLVAITREVSPALAACELTHLAREPIDVSVARAQHWQYEQYLVALGCIVHQLRAEPELPDSVFVEDTAVVLDELAIITRPGAVSRRVETETIAEALEPYRRLFHIAPPGTIDGGDVLRIGRKLFVGLSDRTSHAGLEQLSVLLEPFGYTVQGVRVSGCLHLKSAVTQVAASTLLINPHWTDAGAFGDLKLIEVDESEPFAANALLIEDTVIYPTGFPATRRRLEDHGISVMAVDATELGRAEGGVTCCSLVFSASSG